MQPNPYASPRELNEPLPPPFDWERLVRWALYAFCACAIVVAVLFSWSEIMVFRTHRSHVDYKTNSVGAKPLPPLARSLIMDC